MIIPTRPPTSAGALRARLDYMNRLRQEDAEHNRRDWSLITQAHARALLNSETKRPPNSIGCITSIRTPPQGDKYLSKNLKHTSSMNPRHHSLAIGFSPHMHQLAIIAMGYGDVLKHCGRHGRFQVSHLCHNTLCFNGDHLVIESPQENNVCFSIPCFKQLLTTIIGPQHMPRQLRSNIS